jgi:hypothetical protein
MSGGPNPAIWAEAARRGLESGEADAANAHDASNKQAVLDETDLQELEHATYYPESELTPAVPAIPAKRSLLDRLLRR